VTERYLKHRQTEVRNEKKRDIETENTHRKRGKHRNIHIKGAIDR
jgi:hypothetical protein